jgi:hypothetical protein
MESSKLQEFEKHLRSQTAHFAGQMVDESASEVAFLLERAADKINGILETRARQAEEQGATQKQEPESSDEMGGGQSGGSSGSEGDQSKDS